ncbi:hypothetical protein Lepto7375DRAFT_7782 [Leptolyngbya sp. PCC 7375]|nr:hypothetical protein Lepto7375DRAFT_7782 [Leptolyngbya sp. PCC 7375]
MQFQPNREILDSILQQLKGQPIELCLDRIDAQTKHTNHLSPLANSSKDSIHIYVLWV